MATPVFPFYFLQTVSPPPSRGGLGSCKQCCQYILVPLTFLYSSLPAFLYLNTWYKRIKFKWQTLRLRIGLMHPLASLPHTWHRVPREQVLCILHLYNGAVDSLN